MRCRTVGGMLSLRMCRVRRLLGRVCLNPRVTFVFQIVSGLSKELSRTDVIAIRQRLNMLFC